MLFLGVRRNTGYFCDNDIETVSDKAITFLSGFGNVLVATLQYHAWQESRTGVLTMIIFPR
jgi:hypothetical protein